MKREDVVYIRYRLTSAQQESMLEAETLFEKGLLRGTVNRLYYACFYAVEALLWTEGLSSSKHSGVRALFMQPWIKKGHLPVSLGELYRELFDARQGSDYAKVVLTGKEVNSLRDQVKVFLAEITDRVEKKLKSDEAETSWATATQPDAQNSSHVREGNS